MTEVFVQLRDAIVIIEAEQKPREIADRLVADGYDARLVGEMVVVKEKLDA